jgi:hypothetical protein
VIRDFPNLVDSVQRNCHVADARHARDLTLCTYLLEMRDYYRWENDLPQQQPVARADVGRWLSEREALWETLIDESYVNLPVAGAFHDPFANGDINRHLVPGGLLYGAGYGRFGKPHFFLARLLREDVREGVRVCVCGCEYARDISAFPAASQGDMVIVRQESLRRWLAQKTEAWSLKHNEGALKSALDAYGFAEAPDAAELAIETMVAAECETLILHELGEQRVGRQLGPQWEAMLSGLGDRRAELALRAVRDHWADCLLTLPTLLDRGNDASLHFWFANFDGYRLELFPRLKSAYADWCRTGDAKVLRSAVAAGLDHWQGQGESLLSQWHRDGPESIAGIAQSVPRL